MIKTPRRGLMAYLARLIYPASHWAYKRFWDNWAVFRVCTRIARCAYDTQYSPAMADAINNFLAEYKNAKALELAYKDYDV